MGIGLVGIAIGADGSCTGGSNGDTPVPGCGTAPGAGDGAGRGIDAPPVGFAGRGITPAEGLTGGVGDAGMGALAVEPDGEGVGSG